MPIQQVKYRDFKGTCQMIYAREGLAGFSRGIVPRLFTNVPSCALSWGTYEFVKGVLTKKWGYHE